MIRIMGALMTLIKKTKDPVRNITLAMLGLDNAGKTLTARSLLGEDVTNLGPTVGFDTMAIQLGRYAVTLYDLGGGPRIRDIWENYYHELYGIVFVVDSSSIDRMNECRAALVRLLAHERIKGKPMLLLANKQDVPGCLDENELRERLDLERLVNEHCVPCFLVMCSATRGTGRKMDGSIRAGLHWLLNAIEENFEALNLRVSADVKIKKQQDDEEKAKRMERVRLARELRALQEKEQESDGKDMPEEAGGNDPAAGNPFRPVNISELEAKEKEMKRKKKESARKPSASSAAIDQENINQKPHADEASPAHHEAKGVLGNGRAGETSKSDPKVVTASDSPIKSSKEHGSASKKKQRPGSPLPLSSAPKKTGNGNASDDGVPATDGGLLGLRRLPPLALSSPLSPLRGAANDEVSPEEIKKARQRKKKAKKSQVSPGPGSDGAAGPMASRDGARRWSIITDVVPEVTAAENGLAATNAADVTGASDADDGVIVS